MSFLSIILIAIGLSMDAFAVSLTNGMSKQGTGLKKALIIGSCFGLAQGIMPALGYFFSAGYFSQFISSYGKYISLILLAIIGYKMIREGMENTQEEGKEKKITFKLLIIQSIATSIDALMVGVSLLATKTPLLSSVITIGIFTFIISTIGVLLGNNFGKILGKKAEIFGGLILILVGLKIFFVG